MKPICKLAYAALLALSALNFAPTLASAQDEGGRFTLPRDVRWQTIMVPAGEYKFSLQAIGPSEMLKLTKITGEPASFILLVNNKEAGSSSSSAQLVIDSEAGVSYVSSMNLPQFGLTLNFGVPTHSAKELALIQTASPNTVR